MPILVIGNHSDPFTPFSESEELVTDTLSNGYLLETSHFVHIVYPDNDCVNSHVHEVLINGVYPSERRLFCELEAGPPSPEQTVITTKTAPLLCQRRRIPHLRGEDRRLGGLLGL